MPRIQTRRCGCGRSYDLLEHPPGEWSALDRKDIDDLSCPGCGASEHEIVIGTATGIQLGGDAGVSKIYPYFDRSLGVEVRSHQHRQWLMKNEPDGTPRQFPLVPVEGDFDELAELRRKRALDAEVREQEAEINRQLMHPDHRAEIMKARAIIEQYGVSLWEDR